MADLEERKNGVRGRERGDRANRKTSAGLIPDFVLRPSSTAILSFRTENHGPLAQFVTLDYIRPTFTY